ncbi:hypothetical protein QR685DRAFT_545100 [Neurospora intermedia]|uniref:Uncharacterized protein n=1 Tax=Neurospora intermedia TaxID=5142 RepID=A0ABR3DA68_NEUIN
MQPFLSGEITLALLLTVLTLLFFAAAGDEHPYEPYHHSLPVEAGRSSVVDLSSEQPQQIQRRQELIVRLNGLQTHGSGGGDHQSVPPKEHQRRSSEMVARRGCISLLQASPQPQSSTPLLSTVLFKSGGADMSWSLEALLGLLLLGMGLPTSMVATTKKTTSSVRCPTTKRSKRRKSVRFVGVGGGEEETDELHQQQQQQQQHHHHHQQLQDLGLGLDLTRSVVEVTYDASGLLKLMVGGCCYVNMDLVAELSVGSGT